MFFSWFFMFTLPETNIFAPENQGLEDDMMACPFGAKGLFSGAFAVSFRECTHDEFPWDDGMNLPIHEWLIFDGIN